jgi:hypothetical protein
MGLFLGASILSVTELIEFMLFVIWYMCVYLTRRNVMVYTGSPPTFAEKCYNNNGDTLWYQTLQMVGVFFVFPSIFVIILGFPLFDVEQQ